MIRCTAFLLLSLSTLSAESLNYTISYASGLSLGEATLGSNKSGAGWNFGLDVDLSVPGFTLKDHYASVAGAEFCTSKLERTVLRGSRKTVEHDKFDQEKQRVERETLGGGKSDVNVPACARDPLTFLQFVRKELAEGRLAPQQSIVLGGLYHIKFDYAGVENVTVGKQKTEAERIHTTIKGPASDNTIDIFFARDAARTPVMARIPSPLGAFVVELER